MYSKEETHQIKKKFWTSFGSFMKLQISSTGESINWINYNTGIKNLAFKTEVDNQSARISIEIREKDTEIRALMYAQFKEFETFFQSYFDKEWIWFPDYYEEGKLIGKIELKLENVSIFRESDWPQIIIFLKENLMKLDEFWNDVKDTFDIFK